MVLLSHQQNNAKNIFYLLKMIHSTTKNDKNCNKIKISYLYYK